MVEEVGGVDVEDQLAELGGVRLHAPGGNGFILLQGVEQFQICTAGRFEMDVQRCALRDDVRVGIRFLFPLVVGVCVFRRGGFSGLKVAVSYNQAIHAIVSWHCFPAPSL